MATHSSVLAWRIPGTGEPGGLLFMGSHRVGHDWSDLAVVAAQVLSGVRSLFQAHNSDITLAPCLSFTKNLFKHHLVCWTFLNAQDKITPPTTFFYTWLCFVIASITFWHILSYFISIISFTILGLLEVCFSAFSMSCLHVLGTWLALNMYFSKEWQNITLKL